MMEGRYFFYDNLEYNFDNWDYCTIKDRRFYTEYMKGLRPDGKTLITNDPAGVKSIPEGTYDVGDGHFDPVKRVICDYDGNYKRDLEEGEVSYFGLICQEQWVKEKCRYNPRKFEDDSHLDGHADKIIKKMVDINAKNTGFTDKKK